MSSTTLSSTTLATETTSATSVAETSSSTTIPLASAATPLVDTSFKQQIESATSTPLRAESRENDDSDSNASDESDEITEADENEFDRRRAACVAEMRELEAEFLKLKEQLINEKQQLIDQKLKEIEDETAEEFVIPLQKFKQNMEMKLNLTTLMRDYRWKNIEHIFNYEKMSIKQSLENDKLVLYNKHVESVEDEIRKLEESRRQFLLDNELASSSASNLLPGGSYIVYSLQDYDILEDISIIKMHMNLAKSSSSSASSEENSTSSPPPPPVSSCDTLMS